MCVNNSAACKEAVHWLISRIRLGFIVANTSRQSRSNSIFTGKDRKMSDILSLEKLKGEIGLIWDVKGKMSLEPNYVIVAIMLPGVSILTVTE